MDKLFSDFMLLLGVSMIAGGLFRSARDALILWNMRQDLRHRRLPDGSRR
ncbi:hypothetical protein N826_01150 [Skermanella aerolata KACC 11604]|nr:hypothetical protein N826_01150 [Skermanella aerolata KACC 11604]